MHISCPKTIDCRAYSENEPNKNFRGQTHREEVQLSQDMD